LTLESELWSFGNPKGLPSSHFGSVNVIFTLSSKSAVVTTNNH
jgi:hypothetical protein